MAQTILHRYWLEFEPNEFTRTHGLHLGCGVTGYNLDDVMTIVQDHIFKGAPLPAVTRTVADVDVQTLEVMVRSNMLPPPVRGVWFPMGYSGLG